jgi:hypothetical protein
MVSTIAANEEVSLLLIIVICETIYVVLIGASYCKTKERKV